MKDVKPKGPSVPCARTLNMLHIMFCPLKNSLRMYNSASKKE